MKRLVSLALLLLLITPCLRAQRKEISQARSYIKSGKELDKAEKLMTGLLAGDSVNRQNPKIYRLLYQILQKQYEEGNEKLYLKEQYDTSSIFNLTKRMFAIAESLDTLDAKPDKKGNVNPEFRKRHSSELDRYRPNLYNGGSYFVRKSDYQTAFSFFDAYLDCDRQPLFTQYHYSATDTRLPEAAYWAVYCGFKLKEPDKALKYYDVALRDTANLRTLLGYIAEAYNQKGMVKDYVKTLHSGFEKYPLYPYFFPRLVDYYIRNDRLDSALVVSDRALSVDGRNEIFLLAKSAVLLSLGRNEDCMAVSDSLISINDTLPDPYFNAGTACLNKILVLENEADNSRQSRRRLRKLYQQACPYMEKYRELMPADKDKWAPALYRIYLNLNMGKQFEEIDNILNGK